MYDVVVLGNFLPARTSRERLPRYCAVYRTSCKDPGTVPSYRYAQVPGTVRYADTGTWVLSLVERVLNQNSVRYTHEDYIICGARYFYVPVGTYVASL